jgi:mono/diheme cytochrome c family protein
MRAVLGLTFAAVMFAAQAAAQEPSAYLGKVYSQQLCAECHAVTGDKLESPDAQAPTFRAVANTPGMTTMALSAWMYSMHPTMPNIMLKPERGEHIFAYILSLKDVKE